MTEAHGNDGLSLDRLAAILDAYGADPLRWPEAERPAAERLLAASAEAQAMQRQAAALDDVLAASDAPAPSAALRAAILRAAPRPAVHASARRRGILRGLWETAVAVLAGELGGLRPAGALVAVALLLGVATGGAVGLEAESDLAAGDAVDVVHLALLDEGFTGY